MSSYSLPFFLAEKWVKNIVSIFFMQVSLVAKCGSVCVCVGLQLFASAFLLLVLLRVMNLMPGRAGDKDVIFFVLVHAPSCSSSGCVTLR